MVFEMKRDALPQIRLESVVQSTDCMGFPEEDTPSIPMVASNRLEEQPATELLCGQIRDRVTSLHFGTVGIDRSCRGRFGDNLVLTVAVAVPSTDAFLTSFGFKKYPVECIEGRVRSSKAIQPPQTIDRHGTRERLADQFRVVDENVHHRITLRLVLNGKHEFAHNRFLVCTNIKCRELYLQSLSV